MLTQQLTAVEKPVTVPDKNHQSSPLLDTGTHELGGTKLELISTDETPDTMIVDQTCTSSVLESEIPTQSDYEEEDSSVYFVHALLHAIMLILFFSRHLSDLEYRFNNAININLFVLIITNACRL